MKEGQVFPGSKRSKDSKSSAAGDDDQGTESDEGSSVDPLPSNPSSVTLHFDSESDHINASLSGFEANNLSHSQPSSEFEELKFETPTTLTLKQNQPKTSTLPAQAHLSVTSPTSEPQISQSSDVIQCSSSEITVSERRDTLPPDATVLTTFGNLPDLVTQQDNTGFDVAEAENHHRAEEKEHDIVASASFSRTEKTGNESARVAELEQVSNSIGDVSDLEKFDAILLKIREPKGTPLEEVHELEKNARHTEEESEIFNTRPTTTELNETIENRSIKLSDSVQRVITELGETDDLLHETSELDEHAKQAEDVRVVERVELELSEVTEQDNQLAVESISEEVKYFGHMDSQNSTSRSVQAGFLHSEVPAVDVDLQILTDTTKELIADRLPDNSSDSSLLQDSTDGQEDISLQKEVWLSPTSPSSPFTLSDLDGTDDTVEETIQTNEFSKADVADEDVLDAHFSSSGFREEKNEPREVKLSGNFFTEMQNREENLSLHSSADKESFIVEEKSSVSVRESSFQKEKQPKNKSNNELDRKDAAEDWTDSRTQGKSLYEEDTREKETKEAIIGKNVYGDYQRRKPAVEKDPKEELSQEEKGKEQKREIDKNEDSLEAEEKIQTAEKDLNEGDYEEEEGEKGQIDEEDFYKDDFVEEDQGDQTMQKDLTEDSSNEEEECETEEDVSATEEDSLEFKEEEEEERTVEEDLSEVEGDSLELEDQREETGEEELTEDDSQENDGIRERMKVENDFSIEDFHEADSLEKEDDAQTAEEEPSVSEEDSLEPRKDDESSIGDEELTEEDSLGREEDEETMEEEISPTEEGEEMEGEDEMERDVTKHAVKDDGKANVKDEIVPAEEDDMGSKINENRGTEKTKEDKKTGGVGNTGMIQKDETKESQQGTEITQDVQKDLNQEEEGADRKDFIESPRLTVPLPKTTEVEVEIPMINQHMQSRITGGTTGGTTGVTTGETTGMTIGGTTGGTARGTTGVTTGVTTREPTGMTIGATSGMTIGATAGGTTGGTIGGTTKMMETLIAEDEIGMTSDEEMRIFEEEERRITEEERRLVQMQEAQTAADEKTEEHEKRKTGMFEQNKTGFDSNEEVRTIEKQVAEQSELKQALAADGQDRGTTANDWKETSEKEERRISLENEMTDINKIRTSERGQVGIQNEEQQTNEEFGQRIKPKEMESNQQMLDLKSDTRTNGYGKTEASDKDRMMQIGTGMTENKRREITEEKKPVEEQRIRTKEDEEMVQQEKTTAEKDSEEQLTRTKEGEEMVKEEKTTAEKDSEEQLTRTNEDEEMVGQERKTAENDSEKQLTRTEEDEEMVEEEKTTAEKDLKEQRTRIEEDEEMVEEEKTTAEKDLKQQRTRTEEDEEMVEQEKTTAEKDSVQQLISTKQDEEMVEQEKTTAEKDLKEQRTRTEEDEEMVEQEKTTAEKDSEEQLTRTKEDEEMVEQEKTTAEKDSEEQLTRTKEGEEMVKEEKTTAEKDSEEQLTRTNEDEEMVGQERKTAENDSEKQLTRTEEDEEMVEEEKTTAEKDLKEQRTRIEEDEEMVEEEKTTAEKDSEEQLTRTKEDEEMVEEEKTAAEKDSEEQETRTKDEEMVEQERITAEIDSEEQLTSTKEDEEMVEEKKTTAEKDSEEHLTRTEDEEMVEQERTNAEIDSEEQLTRSKEDEEMVEEQRTTVEKDLEEPRTRTKENEEVVQQEKKTAEKDLEARRTRTKEYEEMVEQEKKTAEKDSEEQQTRTRDEEMVEEEKTTKENEEMVEEEKTTAEKDSKEQRTRTEEDEEMVKEEKTTAEKDLMEQRTRTEEDEEMVKEEMTTAEKDLKEQRTRAKQDEEMVEQEKTTAEKDSEEQQTRTIEDEEMVKEEKTIAEKDLEEHRTRIREDEEMVKQEKTTGEKDVGEAYSLEEGTEEQLTRTKKGEEMVGQERITAEKDSEEQLTRTKDEEMVEEEKTTAEKYSGEQLTRTKEDEEMVEEEKTTAEKDLEEPRTRTKENEEVVQQEKTTAEKDSGEQLTRTKEDEAMVEQERTNPEKDLEEPRTRTKEDEEMLEQEITTSEKYLEEERTRTKEDEEMVGQERPSPEKDLEKQRTRTKEDEEMVEQERITPEKDLEEQRTRTKEGEEMIEQEKTAAEKNLGEENSEEEGTVTTENVETQFAKTKERGMNDMEQTGLTTEKEKTGKTEQWEIPAMTKQETTEGSGRKKSGIVPVETRVTEKEKPGVSVKSKTDVTQHEELGTQEQEAAGKIKTKAPDKTGTSEGEIVVEQNTCKAEEEETEISEEAKISENKERGTSDDEEMETSEKDITGAFVRNENKISGEDDTRLIDDKVEIIIEERDAEESIKMSKENKSEINGVDKNGLGSGFEISEKTGMPSITACGADNIEDTNDEILCDGTHEKRKKELKNSAEMAITSHFGKEMTLEENKTKAATDDASMTSLNETELTTGSQMGISDDEENYIQADHRLKVEDHEEIEKKPQKRNSYVDDNFVDDVLEPGFAFSIMSSDSELDTDDEALFFGEKELTTGQLCRMPAQSHRKRHESYDEEDEDPVWSGYEPVVLFSDESLQSASRSTPRFHGDGLYFEKLSPNMKSAVSTHASSNQFPLRHDQISQSEISNDSMLKQNHDATKRDLELARLLNLPQKSFASSVGNGQIGSKFGVSKEAKQASETQNNLPFPVGSSWLPPTTAAEKGAEIKKNPLTFGKSSRWTNDSSQFAHPDQQVTLEDSYLVPNGMALGGTTRESKTLHEDFGSMSGKSWQTHRNSVNGRANGIMSNSANGAVNGSVSYSASGGVNGKIGNGDSGRYHGSVDNSVGLLMCQSCTAQRLYGSSDGTLNELGDVWSRLRGSHTEDCEGKMSHLEEMIHPLECNHQTPTTPTSLSCFISPLSKQQEPQRPSGTAYRFMGKGTFTKSSRDDTATFPVHDYLEGDTLWKAEKARIFKGLNLRPTKFSSAYVTARNATPRSVEDQQQTSSISALVDNMKSINSRLRKEADDHLWKENLALWKELEQEHLTYKRELELHQTNQRRNNRTIKDLQQQISFLETEMSKRIMTLHDFTRP